MNDQLPIAENDAGHYRCSLALGRGLYCKGDARFPETHATRCPRYAPLTGDLMGRRDA